jgi:hypothetical protein
VTTIAESVGAWLADIEVTRLPGEVIETSRKLLVDVAGLCLAAAI